MNKEFTLAITIAADEEDLEQSATTLSKFETQIKKWIRGESTLPKTNLAFKTSFLSINKNALTEAAIDCSLKLTFSKTIEEESEPIKDEALKADLAALFISLNTYLQIIELPERHTQKDNSQDIGFRLNLNAPMLNHSK